MERNYVCEIWKHVLTVLLGFETNMNKEASTWWKDLLNIIKLKTNSNDYFAGNVNCRLGK